MKAKVIATSVGLALAGMAGQASAVDVYVSSATALRDTVVRTLNQFCDPALPRTASAFDTTPGVAGGVDNDFRVYECTFAAGTPQGLGGVPVRLFHTVKVNALLGGSLVGVTPIFRTQPIQMKYVTPTSGGGTCAAEAIGGSIPAGFATFGCSTTSGVVPEVGVSDTEPKLHSDPNNFADPSVVLAATEPPIDTACEVALWKSNPLAANNPAGCPAGAGLAAVTSNRIFATGFGWAISNNVRARGITNLTESQLRSIYSGSIDDWQMIDGGASAPIQICRRTRGSGTQTTINALINEVPCQTSGTLAIQDGAVDTTSPLEGQCGAGPNGLLCVHESPSTTGVKNCLADAQNTGRLAIGWLSLENNEAAATWQFVDVNGVRIFDAATDNVDGFNDRIREDRIINGSYPYYVESWIQWKNNLAGQKLQVANLLRLNAGPGITNDLPGIVSLQSYYPGGVTPVPTPVNQFITPYTRDGNSCQASRFQLF
jgi:hypothetical protein